MTLGSACQISLWLKIEEPPFLAAQVGQVFRLKGRSNQRSNPPNARLVKFQTSNQIHQTRVW